MCENQLADSLTDEFYTNGGWSTEHNSAIQPEKVDFEPLAESVGSGPIFLQTDFRIENNWRVFAFRFWPQDDERGAEYPPNAYVAFMDADNRDAERALFLIKPNPEEGWLSEILLTYYRHYLLSSM